MEARLLELEMWTAATRLNLSDFERAAVRLRSGGLEREAARLCELARAVILGLGSLKREMARLKSDGFEWVAVGLRGLCELAAKLNLDDLEREAARPRSDSIERAAAVLRGLCGLAAKPNLDDLEQEAVRLCEPGTQMAVAARLNACGVVWTGAVREAEVEIRVARRPRKTTHRHLSCVYVAESGVCRCYVELNACGKSVAAVRLSCALSRAWALVAR